MAKERTIETVGAELEEVRERIYKRDGVTVKAHAKVADQRIEQQLKRELELMDGSAPPHATPAPAAPAAPAAPEANETQRNVVPAGKSQAVPYEIDGPGHITHVPRIHHINHLGVAKTVRR